MGSGVLFWIFIAITFAPFDSWIQMIGLLVIGAMPLAFFVFLAMFAIVSYFFGKNVDEIKNVK